MSYKEKDIMHENGHVWVLRTNKKDSKCYTVFFSSGFGCSESDCSFALDTDGLSCAIARADYLASKLPDQA